MKIKHIFKLFLLSLLNFSSDFYSSKLCIKEHILFQRLTNTFKRIMILIITLSLVSCSNNFPSDSVEKKQDEGEKRNKQELVNTNRIVAPEGEFLRISGWLDAEHFLYITNFEYGSNLYVYDIIQGVSEPFFKSAEPIAAAYISPSGKSVAIHSSPTSNSAMVTVLDRKGSEIWSRKISSFDLTAEWNPFDENILYISSFKEDWTFKSYFVNIMENSMVEVQTRQPFIKWLNREEFAFLDWQEGSPSLTAPLIKKNSKTGVEESLLPVANHFSTFKDLSYTITVDNNDRNKAMYQFYNQQFRKSIYSFSVPQLSRYADWLIPFNDYINENGRFITFVPLNHGSADVYNEGFNLVSYDLKTMSNGEILMSKLENEPISCRKSGDFCLYGYRFEKLMDLKTKKIYDLFE